MSIDNLTKSLDNMSIDSIDSFINNFNELSIESSNDNNLSNFINKFQNLNVNDSTVQYLDNKLIDKFNNIKFNTNSNCMNFILCIHNIIQQRKYKRCGDFIINNITSHLVL